MTRQELPVRLRALIAEAMPLPGGGHTAERHQKLFAAGRENLSLARLAEAHWDAVAILAEAGRSPHPGAIYGVWASEKPGLPLSITSDRIHGGKMFCSGAGLIDRALLTVTASGQVLVDVDLRANADTIVYDTSAWQTDAFLETDTATATFSGTPAAQQEFLGGPGWYLSRVGFWQGACGPAACWAGGAAGLLDYAMQQHRADAHTLAHLGAMHASVWALQSFLDAAAREMDAGKDTGAAAQVRALTLRHLVEQACTDVLRRLPRAYGPHPLAMQANVARRYHELDLYLRQSHAERDLEALGRALQSNAP